MCSLRPESRTSQHPSAQLHFPGPIGEVTHVDGGCVGGGGGGGASGKLFA